MFVIVFYVVLSDAEEEKVICTRNEEMISFSFERQKPYVNCHNNGEISV